jgi:hypothetical protein
MTLNEDVFRLIAPTGFGKTTVGQLWCAYYQGDASKFEWHPKLKQQCLANKDKFNVVQIDLATVTVTCPLEQYIADAFDSEETFKSDNLRSTRQFLSQTMKKNTNYCIFIDHCEECVSKGIVKQFSNLVLALTRRPKLGSLRLFFASASSDVDPLAGIPSIAAETYLGYSPKDIEDQFGAHLKLLQQIVPFKNESNSVVQQIKDYFSTWPEHLFRHSGGERYYSFSHINALMSTGNLPDRPTIHASHFRFSGISHHVEWNTLMQTYGAKDFSSTPNNLYFLHHETEILKKISVASISNLDCDGKFCDAADAVIQVVELGETLFQPGVFHSSFLFIRRFYSQLLQRILLDSESYHFALLGNSGISKSYFHWYVLFF